MAELLYRLGKFSARRAWQVIVAWLVILAIAVTAFLVGYKGLTSSFDIPGTASGAVIDELQKKLPAFSGASGTVVFTTKNGSALSDAQRADISALIASADDLPGVTSVTDPFQTEQKRADQTTQVEDGQKQVDAARAQLDAAQAQLDASGLDAQTLAEQQKSIDSSRADLEKQSTTLQRSAQLIDLASGIRLVSQDGSTALVPVAFTKPRLELAQESKDAVMEHFDSAPIAGVEVVYSNDISQGVPEIFGVGEVVGLVAAGIVLLVLLGTLLTAMLPIVTALVGVGIGVLSALSFSSIVQMASVTPVLGIMLGLAVGIDYSLFIINRHRKQLRQGAEVQESIGLANGTSGNAVVFAGSTVIVALIALNVTGIPFLGLMGTVGAACVAVAVLIAITLTPALLRLAGEHLLPRRLRVQRKEAPVVAQPVRPMSTLRAILTAVGAIAVLLTIAIPTLSMRLGLPDGSSEPVDSSTYRAYTITEHEFGAGANSAIVVTASLPAGLDDDGVMATQLLIAQKIHDQPDVVSVAPIAVSDDSRLTAFQVIPAEGPNSPSTEQLVRDLRSLPAISDGIVLGVAGQAAVNIDISTGLADVLPLYLALVVGLSLLIMIVVFRSLVVPVIATGGFILSLFATYGATVAVFQWGWFAGVLGINAGPILSFLPVILVGILFGLAMDYQLFLASGMREAYMHGAEARLAVAKGFRAGRAVVIAAALIMVSVFGGFVFSHATIIRSIGFGLAFGVLIDAFVVRMLLMPAIMHLIGRAAWWLPRWLDRLLPNVDVEGSALERRHHL